MNPFSNKSEEKPEDFTEIRDLNGRPMQMKNLSQNPSSSDLLRKTFSNEKVNSEDPSETDPSVIFLAFKKN